MVRKLKIVDVAPTQEAIQTQEAIPVVEIKPIQVEEVEPSKVEEVTPMEIEPVVEAAPEQIEPVVEAKPEKKKEPIEEIVCSNCNKKMLMKTYKYSHQKICKPDIKEAAHQQAPPSPPKQKPDTVFNQAPTTQTTVSFDVYSQPIPNGNPYLNSWNELRQQRQQVRQQRVKSLISQAI